MPLKFGPMPKVIMLVKGITLFAIFQSCALDVVKNFSWFEIELLETLNAWHLLGIAATETIHYSDHKRTVQIFCY